MAQKGQINKAHIDVDTSTSGSSTRETAAVKMAQVLVRVGASKQVAVGKANTRLVSVVKR